MNKLHSDILLSDAGKDLEPILAILIETESRIIVSVI